MKKNKSKKEVVYHQHKGPDGAYCGMKHPEHIMHKKASTQIRHSMSILNLFKELYYV
jgi:hypothetical protein